MKGERKPDGPRCYGYGLSRAMTLLQVTLGGLILLVTLATLHRFNATGGIFAAYNELANCGCQKHAGLSAPYADFDLRTVSERMDEVLSQIVALQDKLEQKLQQMDKSKELREQKISGQEFRTFLDEQVIQPLYTAHVGLRLARLPGYLNGTAAAAAAANSSEDDPLISFFAVEEVRKYIRGKEPKPGMENIHGSYVLGLRKDEHGSNYNKNRTHASIGHTCVLMKKELEQYMDYEMGSYCPDDWHLGQKLMLAGCDPLPSRRCLTRASRKYRFPYPINESLWKIPEDRNVRWSNYVCRNYKCLSSHNPKRGFSRCSGCFEMDREVRKWAGNCSAGVDFVIREVLAVKPAGEIRIGLDVSIGVGTFAARMREWNVTVVSTALNIGAPFSETIALRGLVPLYVTLNQRLPFFDNTMDLIHTHDVLYGWIDLQRLDFILYDWDRVLRPGGLLWVDRFYCDRKDLNDYTYIFHRFGYKKHRWVVIPKSKDQVYLSALMEKPPRTV